MIRLLTCSFLVFASIASCSGSSEVSHTESYASLAHPGAPASQIASESASPTSEASQASSPAHAPAHEAGPEEGEERKPVDVLSLFVIALLIGVFTHHVLKFTRLPYTALLMIWGLIIGIGNETFSKNWHLLGPGTQMWKNIDPELLLNVFLPVLLFAGAFALEWHIVRRLLWSSLILAGPGVLVGMGLTAVLVKYTFPYNWTWIECLLFGAIFSATDPVAVVAVLREAGLSTKLRTLVDSEALLNDGSAYVLFFLLRAWAEGAHQTAGDAVKVFCQLTLGGPTAGLVFAVVTTLWLRQMYNNEMGEIVLTIVAAFGTYLVSDQLLHVSGVLAVVVLGTYMSAMGANHISRVVIHPLHIVWETLEYVANTLIFILSGVIIAAKIYTNSVGDADEIHAIDYGFAVLLWVYLLVIRGLLFVIFWPALKNMGYGLDWKQAVVLSWSGLRGAVGLSLSLFVLLDGKISDVRFRTQTFFHMGAVAFLTLMIQGSTMGLLLTVLGMTKPASIKRGFLRHLLQKTEEEGDAQLGFAVRDKVLGDPDWQQVRQLSSLDHHLVLKRYMSKLNVSARRPSQVIVDVKPDLMALRMNRTGLLAEKRTRFLTAVRRTYEDFFHDSYVTSSQVYYLRDSADRALDEVHRPLRDWGILRKSCKLRRWVRWVQRRTRRRLARYDVLADPLHGLLVEDLRNAATLALAFCHAHEITAADLLQHEGLGTIQEWTEDKALHFNIDFALLHNDMKHNVTLQVIAESKAQLAAAQMLLAEIKEAFPEVMRSIKTTQLAQELLLYKEELLKEIGETGLIEEAELAQMQDLVEKKLKHLHFHPPQSASPHPATLLARHPMFGDIPAAAFRQEVLRPAALRVYEEGDALNMAGREADAVAVLLRGSARLIPTGDLAPRSPHIASAGAVLFCWPALLEVAQPFQGVAATVMLVYRIPLPTFRLLMSKYKSVSDGAWQACGAALSLIHGGPLLESRTFNELCALFRQASVESLKEDAILRVAGTAFLASGSIRRESQEAVKEDVTARYQGPCLLPSHPENYHCLDNVKVLHLPPEYDYPDSKVAYNGKSQDDFQVDFANDGDDPFPPNGGREEPGLPDLVRSKTLTLGNVRAVRTDGEEHVFHTRSLSPRHQGLGHRHSFDLPSLSPQASQPGSDGGPEFTWSGSMGSGLPAHAATVTAAGGKALARDVRAALHPEHGATVSGAAGKNLAKEVRSAMATAAEQPSAARARGRRAGLTGWAMTGDLQQQQGAVNFEESVFSASQREHRGRAGEPSGGTAGAASPTAGSAEGAASPRERSRVARMVSAIDHGRPLSSPSLQAGEAGPALAPQPSAPGTAQPSGPSTSEPAADREPSVHGAASNRAAASNQEGSVHGRGVGFSQEAQSASANAGKPVALQRMSTGFRSTLQRNSTLSRSRYAIAQAMLQQELEAAEEED